MQVSLGTPKDTFYKEMEESGKNVTHSAGKLVHAIKICKQTELLPIEKVPVQCACLSVHMFT